MPRPGENAPLLPPTGHSTSKSFDLIGSTRHLLLGSWLNLLLVAVPLSFVAEILHWSAVARFVISFTAVVPLAKVRQHPQPMTPVDI